MQLLLTRHGETDWNTQSRIQGNTDTVLNENGIRQAQELARRLAGLSPRPLRVYSSRHKRALQTADIAAGLLELPCIVQPGIEEISFGLWEGLTWKQVQERFPGEYPAWHEDRRYRRPPEGESYQDLLDRVLPALARIVEAEGGPEAEGQVVVVTHSAVIMSVLCFLDDAPFHEMVKRYRTENAGIYPVEGRKRHI